MEETAYTCKVCGKSFSNSRALGSHMHYKHGSGEGGGEALDLKSDFESILRDVGIRQRAKTIADIYFDMGADDLTKLNELLNLAGITNPQKALILKRWGQKIGKEPPPELVKAEGREEDSLFKAYEKFRENELRELLMEDLRLKIEERKKKLGLEETKKGGGGEIVKVPCPCLFPIGHVLFGQDGRMTYFCASKQGPCPFYAPVELATCSHCHLDIRIDGLPMGAPFMCPRCGAEYIKTHPGRIVLAKSYAPLPMLQ